MSEHSEQECMTWGRAILKALLKIGLICTCIFLAALAIAGATIIFGKIGGLVAGFLLTLGLLVWLLANDYKRGAKP